MSLVLVKGRPRSWQTFVLTATGLALLLLALVLSLEQRRGVVLFSTTGAVLLTIGEIVVRLRRRGCRWVEDLGDGFLVVDHQGEHEYRDDDVAALSFYQFERHNQGLLAGTRRHFDVWVSDQERPIAMTNAIDVGEPDPLERLIDRITRDLYERTEEQLAAGRLLEGDRWRLDRWGLAERESVSGSAPQELPIDEITGVELIGPELHIWHKSREQVALRIPIASRNAHLLYLYLDARVVETEVPPPQAPQEGLGRLLFELGYKRRATGMLVLAIGAASAAGLCLWAGDAIAVWGAGALAVATVALLALANFYRTAVLRCYEFGLFQTGMMRDREMKFDEITTLTYAQERQFYRSEYTLFKGVYTGTSVSIRLEAAPDSGLRPISYGTTLRRPDENIDRLRERVSEKIADLMERYLDQGQPIHWTNKITLRPEGIEYVPKQFVGRRSPEVLPYEFIGHHMLVETSFAIWHDVSADAIIEEPTSQKNFYPGLALFERLLARRAGSLVVVDAVEDEEVIEDADEFDQFSGFD